MGECETTATLFEENWTILHLDRLEPEAAR